MATTLEQTGRWAKAFVNFAQLNVGVQNEPSLTSANTILQTITGPPFIWPWNRNKFAFLISSGVQDYAQTISDFGFMEAASVQPAATITQVARNASFLMTFTAANGFSAGDLVTVTGSAVDGGSFNVTNVVIVSVTTTQFTVQGTSGNVVAIVSDVGTAVSGNAFALEIKAEALTEAVERVRPNWIGTQINGNSLSFRVVGIPEQTYQVVVTYQKAPTMFTALTNSWPIPDKVQYIYNYGFLYMMLDFYDDARAGRYRQMFIATLLGAQSGLSEQDKKIFLGSYLPFARATQAAGQQQSQGVQARGV